MISHSWFLIICFPPILQEAYIRARDDPFFDGMRRGEATIVRKGSAIDSQGNLAKRNSYRSASDVGNRGSRNVIDNITEEAFDSPKNSPLDIVLEPIGRSSSGRWSKTASPLLVTQSDLNMNIHDMNETLIVSSPDSTEGTELVERLETSYHVRKRQTDISSAPLPPSAALFYQGSSMLMEVSESSASVNKLNMYLKARRDDVNCGVPGRFLHAVIGPDGAGYSNIC